jgi:hypothetical protein
MGKIQTKLIAIFLIISIFTMALPKPAKADIWGESIYGAMTYKQILEEMYKKIQDTLVASLRNAAIRLIQSRLMALLGSGGKNGPGPIADWRQFIYSSAMQYSTQVTNDFFRNMRTGLPSPVIQRIVSPAQKMTTADPSEMKPDIQNYVREGRADKIFAKGYATDKWEAWRRAAMPQNSPAYLAMVGTSIKQESARQQEEIKKTEGAANAGYQSKKDDSGSKNGVSAPGAEEGKTITPGSTVKDTVTKVQGMPIDMISMARTIPDVVAGMVTSMLTQMLNRGLTTVTSQINKQIGGQIGSAVSSTASSIGNTVIRTGTSGVQQMIQKGMK